MEEKEDYFSLKWSNFRSSYSEGFYDFLQEEAMVDVTLAVEGKFVQAHKLVLSVCSPYFKNLFKVNPCKHPIVILKDVGHSDLSYMLEFMYKGEVGVKHEDLPSFLKLAETLKLKGLAGEEIEKNENYSFKNLDSNLARVRKKPNRDTEVSKEYTEFQSSSEQPTKKLIKSRKRRLSCKSESVKMFKSKNCEVNSVNNSVSKDCDDLSEDEDNKPLFRFIGDQNVKFEKSLKEGESQCDNENESQCDNKTSFSGWSDEIPNSEDSGGPDIHSLFQSDYSEETEETPQGHLSSVIISRAPRAFVWDYFLKETHQAVCLNCGKAFKGQRPNTICEQHLKRRHPEFYKILLEKKIKRAELHMNPMIWGFMFILDAEVSEVELTPATVSGGVDYQMIQTKRGRDMLLFGGYTFTQNRMCKDGMRWQCSYPKCKAFCRMSSAGWLTPYKTHHEHPKPSEREIKKRILRMELKARAQSSGATPGEILRNALPAEEFHSTDRACFTRCIQRFRKSLQRKNSKPQEEVWQSSSETEKNTLKSQPPTNGEPSWLPNTRSLMPVSDSGKVDDWHSHQDPTAMDKEVQMLDGKEMLQGKIEPYGI